MIVDNPKANRSMWHISNLVFQHMPKLKLKHQVQSWLATVVLNYLRKRLIHKLLRNFET